MILMKGLTQSKRKKSQNMSYKRFLSMKKTVLLTVGFIALCVLSKTLSAGSGLIGAPDAHGCYPSAGYTWCASLGQCIRPFEQTCPE